MAKRKAENSAPSGPNKLDEMKDIMARQEEALSAMTANQAHHNSILQAILETQEHCEERVGSLEASGSYRGALVASHVAHVDTVEKQHAAEMRTLQKAKEARIYEIEKQTLEQSLEHTVKLKGLKCKNIQLAADNKACLDHLQELTTRLRNKGESNKETLRQNRVLRMKIEDGFDSLVSFFWGHDTKTKPP